MTDTAPPVEFEGDELRVRFSAFGPAAYALFLKVKAIPEQRTVFHPEDETYTVAAPARFASLLGVERPARAGESLPLHERLYDDQRYLVGTALDAKRFAIWSDCGGGKTLAGLEWARHVAHRTGGRVLVVTLNEPVGEWLREAAKFYGDGLPVRRIATREEMKEWCAGRVDGPERVAVTNYEKFNHRAEADQVVPEVRRLAGLVLDESSRLKTGGGRQKWALIKSGRGVEYKLSLTATPAPNNAMEFASQAAFLEKMRTATEVIWTYFAKGGDGEWTVKPHAREAFFRWMASWSVYVRDYKRFGWRLTVPDVPGPEYVRVPVDPTPEQRRAAQDLLSAARAGETGPDLLSACGVATRAPNAVERVRLSEIAKGFLYAAGARRGSRASTRHIPTRKPAAVCRIVADEAARGSQVLVWTVFEAESQKLDKLLRKQKTPHEVLTGATTEAARADILDRFRRGEVRVLVSRASLLGFGTNFQFVRAMVFSGWTDSYEQFYQAVRRAVRHGQTERVRVYLPFVVGLEDETLATLDQKAARVEREIAEMEAQYVRVLKGGA